MQRTPNNQDKQSRRRLAIHHPLEWAGWLLFLTGTVGIVVPLLPTTIFWIGAAWCWTRSSPHRLHWLLKHPKFGRSVDLFLHHGMMTRGGKIAAATGISFGFCCWYLITSPSLITAAGVLLAFSLLIWWLFARPEPESDLSNNQSG